MLNTGGMPADSSAAAALIEAIWSFESTAETIRDTVRQIHDAVLERPVYIRVANFTAIHVQDVEYLFNEYDSRFLQNTCRKALNGERITFTLSSRMTSTGGKTSRIFVRPTAQVKYGIAIASGMLFDSFGTNDRPITVGGIECRDRLEALQQIFEHELVHLVEFLCWQTSNCAAPRFQSIARRLFLHESHTHDLITRRERAADSGIRVGSRVSFEFEGRQLTGRVNRITKRATVLVVDARGHQFADGVKYRVYYVPISLLQSE